MGRASDLSPSSNFPYGAKICILTTVTITRIFLEKNLDDFSINLYMIQIVLRPSMTSFVLPGDVHKAPYEVTFCKQ